MQGAHLLLVPAVFVSLAFGAENTSSPATTSTIATFSTATSVPDLEVVVTESNITIVHNDSLSEESNGIRRVVTIPPGRFIVKPADNKMVVKFGDYLHVMNRPPDFAERFKQIDDFEQEKYFRGMGKYRDRYHQHHFRRKKHNPPYNRYVNFMQTQNDPQPVRSDYPSHPSYPHYGSHFGKVYTMMKEIKVPFIVPVEKEVPVPIKVLIDRPYPVKVIKPYPVPVQKEVPIPFKVPYPQPVPVIKKVHIPVTVPVERHVPVPVPKPVPYFVTKKVKYPVIRHIPVQVKVPVEVPRPYPVYINVRKNVPLSVEKPYYVPYKYNIDRPYPVSVPKPYPVIIEKPVPVAVEKPYQLPVQVPVPVSQPVPIPVERNIPIYVPINPENYSFN